MEEENLAKKARIVIEDSSSDDEEEEDLKSWFQDRYNQAASALSIASLDDKVPVKSGFRAQDNQASSPVISKQTRKSMCFMPDQGRGKNQEFHESAPRGTKRSHFKNGIDYLSFDNISQKKPLLKQFPCYVAPLAAGHPSLSPEGSSSGNCSDGIADNSKCQDFKSLDMEDRVDGVPSSSQFDIASTSKEEVKISLICNSSRNTQLRSQSLSAVLGEVEDECRRKFRIQDPEFSLVKLMERVCNCFLELDTDSKNEFMPKTFDSLKKSGGKLAIGAKDNNPAGKSSLQQGKLNGLVYHQNIVQGANDGSKKMTQALKAPQSSNLHIMEAILQKKYPIYLEDIARGEENLEIPLGNENGALELPNFLYIRSNMVHKDAHVDFSLARISDDNFCAECYGDCLSSALPCACAGETLGEFAYTQEGLLKEEFLDECIAMSREPERKHFYYCEICPLQNDFHQIKGRRTKPCKGHLTRKFIKECWSKCGCSRKCRNRVVQQGIQVALQVIGTPEGKGWGVRSVNALKKGTFICEYIGEIVTNQELYERNKERAAKQEKHTYPVLLDADWGSERILKDEEALCLDATEFGNVGRFINHRCCDANLIEIPVEVETPDHHYYHLAFFTTKDIEPMEELTWDYGIEFDDKYHPIKAFKCKCGSTYCRDRTKLH